MNAEEHILAYIESDKTFYDRLLHIAVPGNFIRDSGRAAACSNLAISAYCQMIKCGDAWAGEHDASSILRAAVMISEWRLEQ